MKSGWAKLCPYRKRVTAVLIFLLLLVLQQVQAQQPQTFNIHVKNVPVVQIFKLIEQQSPYRILYLNKNLDHSQLVRMDFKGATLAQVLDLTLKNQPVSYKIDGNSVLISPKAFGTSPSKTSPEDNPGSDSIKVSGRVTSDKGIVLPGATVKLEGSSTGVTTDEQGQFKIVSGSRLNGYMIVSYVGFNPQRIQLPLSSTEHLNIELQPSETALRSVDVVSTGYQSLPKERVTGSFSFVNNEQFNRAVSPNFIDRLKGNVSGLTFDQTTENQAGISIRGRSTIFANTQPLIILDNFPFDGDLSAINPNDIESVSVLKDAAAASIWGARAANGVIVVTSKKGGYNRGVQVSLNSNVTFGAKPDLYYAPRISSKDYIDLERNLFSLGYYQDRIDSYNQRPLTPVVEILLRQQNGSISQIQADTQIEALSPYDLRQQAMKYLYQNSMSQQYNLSLNGGNDRQKYFVSLGYDGSKENVVANKSERISFNGSNTYQLLGNRLEVSTGILYTQSHKSANGLTYDQLMMGSSGLMYPYARLADENGQPLNVDQYRSGYLDTVGRGRLLDWHYSPVKEIRNNNNQTKSDFYLLNLDLKYKVVKGLDASVKYQYGKTQSRTDQLYNAESYYARNYINLNTSRDEQSGELKYAVPLGGIYDLANSTATTQNLRAGLTYDRFFSNAHGITILAGGEIKDLQTSAGSDRLYGYDDIHATHIPVDYVNSFPNSITGQYARIMNNQMVYEYADRYVSYFFNGSYRYKDLYSFSLSARKDASNLFGVHTNQKWSPFWSVGGAWNLSGAEFYHWKAVPYLKMRLTYGYNGNVDKSVSAYLTTLVVENNVYGSPAMVIKNPPNADLRWEKTGMLNWGLDFATNGNRISGTLEVFKKSGKDLMGYSTLTPSSGLTSYKGNTASMKGTGLDLTINTVNINRGLKWQTGLLFSIAADQVTSYKINSSSISEYLYYSSLMEGNPVSSIYSYRWAGLDGATGKPQGFLDGKLSTDYGGIINSIDHADLVYNGPAAPRISGAFMNTFSYRGFSVSVNLIYKMGYYFRRNSINYNALASGGDRGHSDYSRRWQKPGDEKTTNVPALVYPIDPSSDAFYSKAETLVEKADHIRLQDIRLSYDLMRTLRRSLPFEKIGFYIYANNLGILWRANSYKLDPDAGGASFTTPKTIAAGFKIDF